MLYGNLARNENEGDQRAAAKHAPQIKTRFSLQPIPRSASVFDPADVVFIKVAREAHLTYVAES